jgi:hypothetical protein
MLMDKVLQVKRDASHLILLKIAVPATLIAFVLLVSAVQCSAVQWS